MAKADMFLKITGSKTGAVTGESDVQGHEGEIEISGWGWGMSSAGAMSGSGPAARTALAEVRVTKHSDSSTTQLMSVMRNNEQIKEAKLTVRKAGSVPAVDYLTVKLLKARITSYDIGNTTPGSPEMNEKLSMAFEEIEITYAAQDSGGAKTASSTFTAQVHTPN